MNKFFSGHIIRIVVVISFVFLVTLIILLFFGYNITKKRLNSCIEDNHNNYSYFNNKLNNKNDQIDQLKQVASTIKEQHQSYIKFTSKNKKLKFLYNKNWICREVVVNKRVDCYPITRQGEEHDMGLDQKSVYFADITMVFDGFQRPSDDISDSPIKIVKEDVGTFYEFYKNFNGTEVIITAQNPEINTDKKLYNILHSENETDPRCNEEIKAKEDCLCTIEQCFIGYEYDAEKNKCTGEKCRDCCTSFPFKDLEECKSICEK